MVIILCWEMSWVFSYTASGGEVPVLGVLRSVEYSFFAIIPRSILRVVVPIQIFWLL